MKAFVYTLFVPLNFSIKLITRTEIMCLITRRCFLVIDLVVILAGYIVMQLLSTLMYSRNDGLSVS